MTAVAINKAITSIIASATVMILLIFGNFLLRKADAAVFGISLPSRLVHAVLGPALVVLNGVLLVYLCALYRMSTNSAEMAEIRSMQKYRVFGALFNPFFISASTFATSIGYAFLIVLWWLGMHSFIYSVELNPSATGPWLFGWQTLISVIYLALGLSSMLAIQACWVKFGAQAYQPKLWAAFIGIVIGGFLPPILLRLGMPRLPFALL